MAVSGYIGSACIRILTTTVADASPISTLLSPEGLAYSKFWTNLRNEARNGCRLCRILKDYLDQADERSRVRRDRLQAAPAIVLYAPEEERVIHFVLRLSGNHMTISAPNIVFAGTVQYRATTSFGDPAAQFLPQATIKLDRGDRATFNAIRSWVKECSHQHDSCVSRESDLPARLIDLSCLSAEARYLRLYIPKENEGGRYVALSYCWGYSQPVTTSENNLQQHLHKIRYDNLPQTLQDAVKTTKALGIKYLWVDALCIVQDSQRDKQTQMAEMAKIYQNAFFTIVAACSTSSAEGFFQVRDGMPPALELPVGCSGGKIGNIALLPSYEGLRHEPLHERAWTLQEIILSRRLLIFGKDSVGWKCEQMDRGMHSWTDWNGYCASTGLTTIRLAPGGNIIRPSMSIYSANISSFNNPSSLAETQPYIFRLWRDVVKDYSTRSMTNEGDKLNAIAGIVAYFQDVMGGTYLAGLWKKHLLHELCWQVRDARRPAKTRAPSWSWMALNGPVAFHTEHCEWYSPMVDVLSCTVTPVSPTAPFSSVTGGVLVLDGHVSSTRPSVFATKLLSLEDFSGFGMDCDQQIDRNDIYMGIARCLATTAERGIVSTGREFVWGLILRPLNDEPGKTEVYKRVGWFNTAIWNPKQQRVITII